MPELWASLLSRPCKGIWYATYFPTRSGWFEPCSPCRSCCFLGGWGFLFESPAGLVLLWGMWHYSRTVTSQVTVLTVVPAVPHCYLRRCAHTWPYIQPLTERCPHDVSTISHVAAGREQAGILEIKEDLRRGGFGYRTRWLRPDCLRFVFPREKNLNPCVRPLFLIREMCSRRSALARHRLRKMQRIACWEKNKQACHQSWEGILSAALLSESGFHFIHY